MALNPDGDRSKSSPLLRQILQPLSETEAGSGTEVDEEGDGGGGDDDDDDNDNAGGDGGGDDRDGSPNDDGNDDAVAENVVSIVDGMGLGENEAAALRLAIASGDVNIRGALELFRYVGVAWVCGLWPAALIRIAVRAVQEFFFKGQGYSRVLCPCSRDLVALRGVLSVTEFIQSVETIRVRARRLSDVEGNDLFFSSTRNS